MPLGKSLKNYNKAVNDMSIAVQHLKDRKTKKNTKLNASQSIMFSANNVKKSMKSIQANFLRTTRRNRRS